MENKDIVIFGVNNFAEMMYTYLANDGYNVVAFCVNSAYRKQDSFIGLEVIDFESLSDKYSPETTQILICIGYKNMNKVREQIYYAVKNMGYDVLTYKHRTAYVDAEKIGEGCIFLENSTCGFKTKLGICNILYPNAQLAHHSVVGNFNFFAVSCSVAGSVVVKDRCFIGNNATTKNGIIIEDETLIGAGCYLSKDSEKSSVYVPCRSIRLDKKSGDLL